MMQNAAPLATLSFITVTVYVAGFDIRLQSLRKEGLFIT